MRFFFFFVPCSFNLCDAVSSGSRRQRRNRRYLGWLGRERKDTLGQPRIVGRGSCCVVYVLLLFLDCWKNVIRIRFDFWHWVDREVRSHLVRRRRWPAAVLTLPKEPGHPFPRANRVSRKIVPVLGRKTSHRSEATMVSRPEKGIATTGVVRIKVTTPSNRHNKKVQRRTDNYSNLVLR